MLYKDETYDIGALLKELREKKGMTQEQLAKKLGVSKGSVSGYEHNISMPPTQIVKRIALIFNVTVDFLLGMENRRIIILDDLTENQADFIEQIVISTIKNFKRYLWSEIL